MLRHCKIIITRPEPQAIQLEQAIQQQGGQTFLLPMQRITFQAPSLIKKQFRSYFNTTHHIHIAIFTSANAVTGLQQAGQKYPSLWHQFQLQLQLTPITVIAIGTGTAHALKLANLPVHFTPSQQNSEGLLALPCLQAVTMQNIVIFCGKNPRSLLKNVLCERRAQVTEIFCYQREQLYYPPSTWKTLLSQATHLICTNLESLEHLLASIPSGLQDLLQPLILIVISGKMYTLATESQQFSNIQLTNNASDAEVLRVLLNF